MRWVNRKSTTLYTAFDMLRLRVCFNIRKIARKIKKKKIAFTMLSSKIFTLEIFLLVECIDLKMGMDMDVI